MTTGTFSEEQQVHLVRNALLVAGHEMGDHGDHWPVINATIHSVMKDWEELKIERNVAAELKKYYSGIIEKLQENLELCSPEFCPEAEKMVRDLREQFHACFDEPLSPSLSLPDEEDEPVHIKRVRNFMNMLEDDNARA